MGVSLAPHLVSATADASGVRTAADRRPLPVREIPVGLTESCVTCIIRKHRIRGGDRPRQRKDQGLPVGDPRPGRRAWSTDRSACPVPGRGAWLDRTLRGKVVTPVRDYSRDYKSRRFPETGGERSEQTCRSKAISVNGDERREPPDHFPKPCVAGSNPAGGADQSSALSRAADWAVSLPRS